MANYNKVVLVGNCTRKPELTQTQGDAFCYLNIAINKKFKNKAGEQVEKVCYPSAQFWGKTAENIVKYVDKGSPVLIEGEIDTYGVEGEDGSKKTITTIRGMLCQFLASAKTSENKAQQEADEDTPF